LIAKKEEQRSTAQTKFKVADVGTGSGNIGLTLFLEAIKKDLKMKTSSGNGKTNFPLIKYWT